MIDTPTAQQLVTSSTAGIECYQAGGSTKRQRCDSLATAVPVRHHQADTPSSTSTSQSAVASPSRANLGAVTRCACAAAGCAKADDAANGQESSPSELEREVQRLESLLEASSRREREDKREREALEELIKGLRISHGQLEQSLKAARDELAMTRDDLQQQSLIVASHDALLLTTESRARTLAAQLAAREDDVARLERERRLTMSQPSDGEIRRRYERLRDKLETLEEVLACPICFETFSRNSAMTLSCGHTICRGCLSAYSASHLDVWRSSPDTSGAYEGPDCPACRHPAARRGAPARVWALEETVRVVEQALKIGTEEADERLHIRVEPLVDNSEPHVASDGDTILATDADDAVRAKDLPSFSVGGGVPMQTSSSSTSSSTSSSSPAPVFNTNGLASPEQEVLRRAQQQLFHERERTPYRLVPFGGAAH